ncbi:MAG: TonB-dependent receptor [Lysobacterales bacterium 14-68-21]|jgi:outer membrane receptor protein involved in Fe transport|nr:MAG: TonB-dependent receptor [Xanthomonadales bacterium 15-68-25]OZB63517.1 MAG: TonB-dependent receptor [Xanthomonadales bacterium 14-68-21]
MNRKLLYVALGAALSWGLPAMPLHAQTSGGQDASTAQDAAGAPAKKAKKLEAVNVTGSLIPQTEIETSTPVTTITADDIKAKGFSSVAEALQATSFATGSVQGQQSSASFTQGAETVSLFGLSPGYVKYLINGRPMGNFPALYNGSDVFNNIAGIPADLVDHIDILPGGQSSLYGSDAIAGVINIVLKDHVDAPSIDVRVGGYTGGGGSSSRISGADSWKWGKLNLLAGFQYDAINPIWGYDRSLTAQKFRSGRTPPSASYDVVEYSLLGNNNYLQDPSQCGNDSSLFGGTEKLSQAPGGQGPYCGSLYQPGYKTITNRQRTGTAYAHATYDVSDNFRLYGDVLYRYADTRYAVGSDYTFWNSAFYTGPFYDPNVGDIVALQKVFAPEEAGGYSNTFNKQFDNSVFFTVGGSGTFGQSNWDYDVGVTHSEEHLTVRNWVRFTQPIESYFDAMLGPNLGPDPFFNYYPTYSPNYTKFFSPIPVSDFNSFTGYVPTRSKTWDNLLRAQLTNASLFSLPGGDAGLAIVAEGGNSGWDYTPDPGLLNGNVWGQTDVIGNGHRSRNALTAELRLPVFNQLTLDVSGRRDSYKAAGHTLSKSTYMAGVEYRPFESLLLRGRYGTAFKAPTLSDEFQGLSGYYAFVPDYYNCAKLGYSPSQIDQCPVNYSQTQVFGQQAGNPALKPINAKVWSYGAVWAPVTGLSFSLDYFHTSINNEVNQESASALTLTEYECRTGILDITSPTCTAALSQVTRDALGNIVQIFTPKVNVSKEVTNNIIAHASWLTDLGSYGSLLLQGSYSDTFKHTRQAYAGDPNIDLLRNPYYSTDFKTKGNATVTWSKNAWSASLYVDRYGSSPNVYSTLTATSKSSPLAGTLAPWILYNASVRYQVSSALQVSLLVNNLFNTMPPVDHTYSGSSGTPYNVNNYNVFGRAFYLEANYKFGK